MINQIEHSIISKIRDLISEGNLGAGDKFPAELALSEKFEVSRRNIRSAISKLETYDLVKKFPQSGTVIGNIGHNALLGIIDNILELREDNFNSLLETRILLEMSTVKLAAERRSEKDLNQIEEKFNLYKEKTLKGEDATQEDILFHLAIAKACGSPSLNSLMLQITPKLITVFEYNRIASMSESGSSVARNLSDKNYDKEIAHEVKLHASIYESIRDQNPVLAVQAMKNHFSEMVIETI